MRQGEAYIPDHDREAVSEALEAALYCAAFRILEEREMKEMMQNIKREGERQEAAAGVRRRLERRRRASALRLALPRVARAAAAVIAAVSIGTGIALAASPAARQWAAGALYSRVTDPDSFFGEARSHLTGGAASGGRLMVAEDDGFISVYDGTDAEPMTYEWREAGDSHIAALAADGGDVYAICEAGEGNRSFRFDRDHAPISFGLGRVTFGQDGALEIETQAVAPAAAILDPEGRTLDSWDVEGCAIMDGGLYFAERYNVREPGKGFSFAPGQVRMFRWDLADGVLSELDLSGVAFDWDAELFGGPGGVFLAAADDGAKAVRVYRVEGGGLALACEVPYSGTARPHSFAWRESDGALLYVLDGSVWMAPGMEPAKAVRVAVCGDVGGQGLLLDEAAYAIVQGESVKVFDLSAPLGEVDALVVEGDSGNWAVNEAFLAAHPGVAVTGDPGYSLEDIGDYGELLLAGKASGDVVTLAEDHFEAVRDAGLIAPLTDPELAGEWEKLPEGLREYLSFEGQPVALPTEVYAYPDVMFLQENWEAVRGSFEDYPATWKEYAGWLAEFSHSEAAKEYVIAYEALLDELPLDVPEQFELYTLWQMADAYARCWDALGEEIDFGKPEFRECLDALAGVDWQALCYDDYAAENRNRRAVQFITSYDPYYSEEDWEAGNRTLKIRDDAPVISRASGYAVFIPAASSSKATATEYVRTLARWGRDPGEGEVAEAIRYDFATDPEALAARSNGACTAGSIERYRGQVGDMALRAWPGDAAARAIRDAAARYVCGEDSADALAEALNGLYR